MRNCIDCGTRFAPKNEVQKFCNDRCRGRWHSRGCKPRQNAVNRSRPCLECDSPAKAKGYCNRHYKRLLSHGDASYVPAPLPFVTEKQCCGCGQTKGRDEFFAKRKGSVFLRSLCRVCFSEANRWRRILKKFGLTRDDYQRMLDQQGGRCAVCRSDDPLDIDHCHRSGLVRGLLCRRCNLLLGNVSDDPGLLRAAAAYLEGRD